MPSATGVTIRTWGTTDAKEGEASETGIKAFARNYLYNTVDGHVSIELTLPNTKENWQMVEKYLKNTGVPYKKERIEIKKVFYVKGKPLFSEENAYEEEVIRVYFSWWPSKNKHHFMFNTLEQDLLLERLSAEVNYAPEWEAYLQPEKRHQKWLLSKIISLPPNQVLHLRGATQKEISLLETYHQCDTMSHDMSAFNLLVSRLKNKTQRILLHNDLSQTEAILLKRFLPTILSDDREYIDISIVAEKLNIYSQQLQQKHHQHSTLFNSLIREFDREALSKLDSLAANQPLSLTTFKKIKSLLSDHGILIDNIDNFPDILQQLHEERIQAEKNLAIIASELIEVEKQITEIKSQIALFQSLSDKVSAYRERENFADHRKIAKHILQKEKEKLLAELEPFLEDTIDKENIVGISLSLQLHIIKLKTSEHEYKKRRGELLEVKHNSTKQALSLGYGKFEKLVAKHITSGQLPNHTLSFGLKGPNKPGMDPEKMLQQMAAFVIREESFKLITFNCSHTVSDILAAGAGYQGWIFRQRAFSDSVTTPQVVYNNALTYSHSLTPGTKLTEIENEDSWQNYFASWAVSSIEEALDPNQTTYTRIWSTLKALSTAATTVTIENAKAFLDAAHKSEQEDKPKNRP